MGMGKSGELVVKKLKIKIGNFIVAENGKISDNYDEKKLKEYGMGLIEVEINLKLGNDAFKCYTCISLMTILILMPIIEIRND